MCEQLGQEPDPSKMPLDLDDFPPEVQVAFFVFSFMSDNWEGMSGTYLGKNWDEFPNIISTFELEHPKIIFFFTKMYERILIQYRYEEAERKRKAEDRKAKSAGGGKNYTHNVRG
jgi:hypothetical protein